MKEGKREGTFVKDEEEDVELGLCEVDTSDSLGGALVVLLGEGVAESDVGAEGKVDFADVVEGLVKVLELVEADARGVGGELVDLGLEEGRVAREVAVADDADGKLLRGDGGSARGDRVELQLEHGLTERRDERGELVERELLLAIVAKEDRVGADLRETALTEGGRALSLGDGVVRGEEADDVAELGLVDLAVAVLVKHLEGHGEVLCGDAEERGVEDELAEGDEAITVLIDPLEDLEALWVDFRVSTAVSWTDVARRWVVRRNGTHKVLRRHEALAVLLLRCKVRKHLFRRAQLPDPVFVVAKDLLLPL